MEPRSITEQKVHIGKYQLFVSSLAAVYACQRGQGRRGEGEKGGEGERRGEGEKGGEGWLTSQSHMWLCMHTAICNRGDFKIKDFFNIL